MKDLGKEYSDFMDWLKNNHPEIHEKYGRNFSIPLVEGGGVTVSDSYKISKEEHDMLFQIAHSYYSSQ